MNYIVFDLEWNQSAEGKECSVEHMPFEIIEIGAVKLNSQMKQVSEFHRLVQPKAYKEMHFKISEVTHMDMEELCKKGQPFPVVMEDFLNWCGEDEYVFCTWGSMDLTELQRNMTYHGMEIPFPRPLLYYDVQKLYSLEYSDGKSRISLDHAVEQLELNQERPFHRALDDAVYTGRTLRMIHMETYGIYRSIDYYRLPERGSSYKLKFPEYSKYISGEFDCKEEILKDKEISDIICVKCSRMLRKKIRWFSSGQRYYLCLATCPEHGMMKGKIRMKKSEDGRVFAVKTVKPVDEEGAEAVFQKKEEARIRRAEKSRQKKLHGAE